MANYKENYRLTCITCGVVFGANRRTALYCCDRCKKLYSQVKNGLLPKEKVGMCGVVDATSIPRTKRVKSRNTRSKKLSSRAYDLHTFIYTRSGLYSNGFFDNLSNRMNGVVYEVKSGGIETLETPKKYYYGHSLNDVLSGAIKDIHIRTEIGSNRYGIMGNFTIYTTYKLTPIVHKEKSHINERTQYEHIVSDEEVPQQSQNLVKSQKNEPIREKQNNFIKASHLKQMKFDALKISGQWKMFFGKMAKKFKLMVYGSAGGGKSTFCLSFASHLTDKGLRVIYVAAEERFGATLKQKLDRLGINEDMMICENMPTDEELANFDVVVVDSVNEINLDPTRLNNLPCSTIAIFQATKGGEYKGSQAYSHDCDVKVKVDSMKAKAEKNRFGTLNEMKIG